MLRVWEKWKKARTKCIGEEINVVGLSRFNRLLAQKFHISHFTWSVFPHCFCLRWTIIFVHVLWVSDKGEMEISVSPFKLWLFGLLVQGSRCTECCVQWKILDFKWLGTTRDTSVAMQAKQYTVVFFLKMKFFLLTLCGSFPLAPSKHLLKNISLSPPRMWKVVCWTVLLCSQHSKYLCHSLCIAGIKTKTGMSPKLVVLCRNHYFWIGLLQISWDKSDWKCQMLYSDWEKMQWHKCLFMHSCSMVLCGLVISEINLAFNKTAHQSSTYRSSKHKITYHASYTVDGNRDTDVRKGSCSHTNREHQPWLLIDLGKKYNISKVKITSRSDYYSK